MALAFTLQNISTFTFDDSDFPLLPDAPLANPMLLHVIFFSHSPNAYSLWTQVSRILPHVLKKCAFELRRCLLDSFALA